ncbi:MULTISPECIES: hypothetical protein [unclassified Oceanispirochaeta]|uniref:hypothetical protein n=1 Tax=unclassified Oceanispirochaeta TaxID=2635722 RepID=UPI000E093841|nr:MULTISPECIES: hypothetical protein [unclassified Oceanispirochaeta]MBF9018427.1 hypothetical protein [Oceanispirochaeta sp. M2]NPD74858.1 hypothetical protein [Oceanispirochaeta sp. M1]RDG29299.1 hypothetical protein DV872_22435 [Oceanispirochaeta sp. M1]
MNEGAARGIGWKIFTERSEYFYTDRIAITLEIDYPADRDSDIDDEFLGKELIWGDFRLYDIRQIGLNRFILTMQPRKTGVSVFEVPSIFPFGAQFELQISSRLLTPENEDIREALPLIEEKSGFTTLQLIIIIASLIILTALGLIVFLFMKKKRKIKEPDAEPALTDLLSDPPQGQDENECLEFYRNAYRLLIKDLSEQHPGVLVSDSPAELMIHLESPSALNQWALRSLYPLMEDLDRYFYAPPEDFKINENLGRNLEIIKGWIDFRDSEEDKS